jgi:RimJ/RimL family protein N-acetyltransferase
VDLRADPGTMSASTPHLLAETAAAGRITLHRWQVAEAAVYGAAVLDNLDHLRPFVAWVRHEPLDTVARQAQLVQYETVWRSGATAGVYAARLTDESPDGTPAGTLIGTGTINPLQPTTSAEIGYWVDHHHVGHAYATDIAHALCAIAFAYPGITAIEIHHDLANQASARVPRRLGFTYTDMAPIPSEAPRLEGTLGLECRWVLAKRAWATTQAQ